MKYLLVSHKPHSVHKSWITKINAQVQVFPVWFTFPSFFSPFFLSIYSIINVIRLKKSEILLVEGGTCLATAYLAKKIGKTKKIMYLDVDFFLYNLSTSVRGLKKILSTIIISEVDSCISVSKKSCTYSSQYLKEISICPPYPVNKLVKTHSNDINCAIIARLEPDKNITNNILFCLHNSFIKKVHVYGTGSLEKELKRTFANKPVIFHGFTKEICTNATFLIHLQEFDPHPCVTMEAALAGIFPIISNGVGTNYLFSHFITPMNQEDFNTKIADIISHKKKYNSILKESVLKIPTKGTSLNRFNKLFNKYEKSI